MIVIQFYQFIPAPYSLFALFGWFFMPIITETRSQWIPMAMTSFNYQWVSYPLEIISWCIVILFFIGLISCSWYTGGCSGASGQWSKMYIRCATEQFTCIHIVTMVNRYLSQRSCIKPHILQHAHWLCMVTWPTITNHNIDLPWKIIMPGTFLDILWSYLLRWSHHITNYDQSSP